MAQFVGGGAMLTNARRTTQLPCGARLPLRDDGAVGLEHAAFARVGQRQGLERRRGDGVDLVRAAGAAPAARERGGDARVAALVVGGAARIVDQRRGRAVHRKRRRQLHEAVDRGGFDVRHRGEGYGPGGQVSRDDTTRSQPESGGRPPGQKLVHAPGPVRRNSTAVEIPCETSLATLHPKISRRLAHGHGSHWSSQTRTANHRRAEEQRRRREPGDVVADDLPMLAAASRQRLSTRVRKKSDSALRFMRRRVQRASDRTGHADLPSLRAPTIRTPNVRPGDRGGVGLAARAQLGSPAPSPASSAPRSRRLPPRRQPAPPVSPSAPASYVSNLKPVPERERGRSRRWCRRARRWRARSAACRSAASTSG